MPDRGDCLSVVATDTFPPPLMKIELRLRPEDGQFLLSRRAGRALMRGWFRLRNDEPTDTSLFCPQPDAFPPVRPPIGGGWSCRLACYPTRKATACMTQTAELRPLFAVAA